MADPGRTERLTKRTLVTVSHAIEQAALAAAEDGPMVVVALFQRMPYFNRERAVYQRIAAVAAATVVAVVADGPPDLPPGVDPVLLAEDEELAREWVIAVLTPRFGAVLVAQDREEIEPDAETLEAGRLFDGWWRFRRDDALYQVARLRTALDGRLPEATRATIDQVLDRARDLPPAPGETRGEAAMRLFTRQVEHNNTRRRVLARRLAEASAADPDSDAAAGLVDQLVLGRWTGATGTTSSGTLPLGLVAVKIEFSRTVPEPFGPRYAGRGTQVVGQALAGTLRPVDRAVRLADDEFLLVLPTVTQDQAVEVAYQVVTAVTGTAQRYPFIPATATAVVTVTRRRPLPLARLHEALDWAVREAVPVATMVDDPVADRA